MQKYDAQVLKELFDLEECAVSFYTEAQLAVLQDLPHPAEDYAPLPSWAEGEFRKRAAGLLTAMAEFMSLKGCGTNHRINQGLLAVYAPLRDPEGGYLVVDERFCFWIHDMANRIEQFADADEELLAMKETAEFFGDGKAFSMLRWLKMRATKEREKHACASGSIA